MPNYTPNINLEKPLQTENYNIDVHNGNSDKLDTIIKSLQDLIVTLQNKTTPTEILNTLKTVDGLGSGLDADLLDGKSSSEFLQLTLNSRSILLTNPNLNNYTTNGEYYCGGTPLNTPGNSQGYLKVESFSSSFCKQFFTEYTNAQNSFVRLCINGTWTEWYNIGGEGTLFTIPRLFNVLSPAAGQTVFTYSEGAGEVVFIQHDGDDNRYPIITVDGTPINTPNFPYSWDGTSISKVFEYRIRFKNSIVIKITSGGTINTCRGLVMTAK